MGQLFDKYFKLSFAIQILLAINRKEKHFQSEITQIGFQFQIKNKKKKMKKISEKVQIQYKNSLIRLNLHALLYYNLSLALEWIRNNQLVKFDPILKDWACHIRVIHLQEILSTQPKNQSEGLYFKNQEDKVFLGFCTFCSRLQTQYESFNYLKSLIDEEEINNIIIIKSLSTNGNTNCHVKKKLIERMINEVRVRIIDYSLAKFFEKSTSCHPQFTQYLQSEVQIFNPFGSEKIMSLNVIPLFATIKALILIIKNLKIPIILKIKLKSVNEIQATQIGTILFFVKCSSASKFEIQNPSQSDYLQSSILIEIFHYLSEKCQLGSYNQLIDIVLKFGLEQILLVNAALHKQLPGKDSMASYEQSFEKYISKDKISWSQNQITNREYEQQFHFAKIHALKYHDASKKNLETEALPVDLQIDHLYVSNLIYEQEQGAKLVQFDANGDTYF